VSRPLEPDNWPQLEPLLDAVLEAPRERRAELLRKLSGGDAARQLELERLVAECERELPFLDRPAPERFAALFADEVVDVPELLAERYRITRELGRGGMAVVYLARDLKHGRDVAVKVLRPRLAARLGRERYLREIEIAAQLHHPHIVPLYDSGEADDLLYYVMPYEPGASLRERLAREGPLPVDEVVVILRDICDALGYAHQQGIVHRDIKPDNVLLSGRHAMVTDFGVARAVTEATGDAAITTAGIALGTPAYMAPEQIAADPRIDQRADIYALGVLAYELLAGKPPFADDAPQDVLTAHLAQAPADLTSHRPDAPKALVDLVMKCLEKRPAERWQDAEELRTRLDGLATSSGRTSAVAVPRTPSRARAAFAAVAVAVLAIALWRLIPPRGAEWRNPLANARIERITDFPGSEVDAAISADGKLVAFLADQDSVFDAFVTQLGSPGFRNLTGGRFPQLFNEDVRNVGFSADGAQVWIRVADITSPASVFLMPTLGGPAQRFLDRAVMAVWSPDGSRVAYHETTPGDPIYVADRNGRSPRRIFIADPGTHCHHLSWSPDARFLYFSYGTPPDEMDIWRVPAEGGPLERVTRHNARVAYPALLDDRTLIYTATADDGTGPWLYSMAIEDRVAHRLTTTIEHYISVSASAAVPGQPRRLVAAVSNPSVTLWEVPLTRDVVGEPAASRVSGLPTARAAAPRFGSDSVVFYLASRGGADGLWRLGRDGAVELWKAGEGAVTHAPAVSPDGKKVCFPVRRQNRTSLFCMTAEGIGAEVVAESLDVRSAGSWSPDGQWIAVAAKEGAGVRIFKIPINGGPPVRLVDSVSSNPLWSPDGTFIVYSGTPRARNVQVKAVTPEGRPYPLPALSVDRVGDSYRFPGGKQLVVKQGGFRRQDFWMFEIATGRQRRLTSLRPGESLHRFDVSPDGKKILFERVRENSDVVLIELRH
jgi:serine/threonine protein kinase/Tol biopolymer transport system component